ncbi:MAG: hypothetical protein Q9219_004811 [cf. Caloplaca sp. 3 TL-2023]
MDSMTTPGEGLPVWYIGQYESKRQLPVTGEALRQAYDSNDGGENGSSIPTIPSLSPADIAVTPGEPVSQLIGYISPWIDLSSPDPVVYDISRQVLELELSYAAFCGVGNGARGLGNVVIPGPKLRHGSSYGEGVAQYAYAVQEALALSNSTQISIRMPMMYDPDQDSEDVAGSLSPFARPEYVDDGAKSKPDFLGTWDAWHIIRTESGNLE